MNKAIGIAVLAAGIILLAFGLSASDSFASDVSRFFTGSPTDRAMWMIVGGTILAVVGLVVTLRGGTQA